MSNIQTDNYQENPFKVPGFTFLTYFKACSDRDNRLEKIAKQYAYRTPNDLIDTITYTQETDIEILERFKRG